MLIHHTRIKYYMVVISQFPWKGDIFGSTISSSALMSNYLLKTFCTPNMLGVFTLSRHSSIPFTTILNFVYSGLCSIMENKKPTISFESA